MGIIEKAAGEDKLKELISTSFTCEKGQYTHNHLAISELISHGKTEYCLTTNFDNGIERANPSIIPKADRNLLNNIDNKKFQKALIKLHGDVNIGNYIATINSLVTTERIKDLRFLDNFLKSRNILLIGYSGQGDIDVWPHLLKAKKSGAQFIWMSKEDSIQNEIANYWFISDLQETNNNKNWLIKLAFHNKSVKMISCNEPNWKGSIDNWLMALPKKIVYQIVEETLNNRYGFEYLKTILYSLWNNGIDENDLAGLSFQEKYRLARAYIQISLYGPAKEIFDEFDNIVINDEYINRYYFWKTHVLWRMGQLEKAFELLENAINYSLLNKKETNHFYKCKRLFLTLLNERNSKVYSIEKKKISYLKYRFDELLNELISEESVEYGENYQVIVAESYMRINLNLPLKYDHIHLFFSKARNLQYLDCEFLMSTLLIYADFKKGKKEFYSIMNKLFLLRKYNSIRKMIANLLNVTPIVKYLKPLFWLNGEPFNIITSILRQIAYKIRRLIWKFEFKHRPNVNYGVK